MEIVMAGVGALLILALLVVLKRKQIEDPGTLDDDEGDVGWAVVEEDADRESLPDGVPSDVVSAEPDVSDEADAIQDFTFILSVT